jgi:hypothetical protein
MRSKGFILNMCSNEDDMHTNSPRKWAFVHVSYASVPQKITNIPYIKNLHVF